MKTVALVTCPRLWGGRPLGKMGLYSTRASISFLCGVRIRVDEKKTQILDTDISLEFALCRNVLPFVSGVVSEEFGTVTSSSSP